MRVLTIMILLLASAPAGASGGPVSRPLHGFESQQVSGMIIRNPANAIGADPRFEPEQVDPSIQISWTRGKDGHVWADVLYQNPDTGIFSSMHERFEFARRVDGDWDMVGAWKRWKCIGASTENWTTKEC